MDERRRILEQRFWAKVDKNGPVLMPELGPCWEWTACKNASGYGKFGRTWRKPEYAHRVSWEWANGRAVPEGLLVCHKCDNPSCVRAEHLYAGTANDNARDSVERCRVKKTRGLSGERNPRAVLTLKQVEAIEDRYFGGSGDRHRDCAARIARDFGVARTSVGHIIRGDTWKRRARKEAA